MTDHLQGLREMLYMLRAAPVTTHGKAKLKVLALSVSEVRQWDEALSAVLKNVRPHALPGNMEDDSR